VGVFAFFSFFFNRRQLNVLGYTNSFDIYSASSVKELVIWLEDNWFHFVSEQLKKKLETQTGPEWLSDAFHEVTERHSSCEKGEIYPFFVVFGDFGVAVCIWSGDE
jgi:hypothetical protein